MIVYEATKQLFVEDVVQDRIEENIDRLFFKRMGYHTSKSERDAWKNSMQYMLKVLIDNNIPGNVPKLVFNADIVIAVDVNPSRGYGTNSTKITDILSASIRILMKRILLGPMLSK